LIAAEVALRSMVSRSSAKLADRVYWLAAPPEAPYPYAVLIAIPDAGVRTLEGRSSIQKQRVAIHAVAATAGEAAEIARDIEATLIGPHEDLGWSPITGVELVNQSDVAGNMVAGQGQPRFRKRLELLVWSQEK
jgi:hypothetical protein